MRTRSVLVVLAMALAACGGGDAATETTEAPADTTAETTATTAAPETTTTTAEVVETTTGETIVVDSFDDIPGECLDLFVGMLQTLEPSVEDVDFGALTLDELETLFADLDPQLTEFDEGMTAAGCDQYAPDVAEEEVWQEMVDIAEAEAPGTIGFLEWSRDLSTSMDDTMSGNIEGVSGDCATDTAALIAIAEEGKTMQQMTLDEASVVGGLLTSVGENCTVEQLAEVMENPAVSAMIEG